jgi:hypothetical protein
MENHTDRVAMAGADPADAMLQINVIEARWAMDMPNSLDPKQSFPDMSETRKSGRIEVITDQSALRYPISDDGPSLRASKNAEVVIFGVETVTQAPMLYLLQFCRTTTILRRALAWRTN